MPTLSLEQAQHLYSLFDTHVDAGLAWVRQAGAEHLPSVDCNLTASLTLMLQVGRVTRGLRLAQAASCCCCCC